MIRVLSICVVLSFEILQCLSQDQPQEPSVGEYLANRLDLANRTRWRFFLPEDTDIDQDGRLSDLEIQHKFNTYMGELFKLLDDDKNNSITEEEFRSLKLNIAQLTKAVDIALENFPLKLFFLAADENEDGFYDQTDFIRSGSCEVYVGNSDTNPISATVSVGCVCPAVINKYNWHGGHSYPDVFAVTQNGTLLVVERTDYDSGWGMQLAFMCSHEGSKKQGSMRPDRDLIGWSDGWLYSHVGLSWHQSGKFLFLADTNGDEKLSLEELATKVKKTLTKILEVFDGNGDKKISLEDLTSPHFWVGSIRNLTTDIFDDLAAGKEELDLINDMKLVGEEMNRIWGDGRKGLDKNKDMKLNAADVFLHQRINFRVKTMFLLPMLSQKLDRNQDGKIQRQELTHFIDEMMDFLDMDKDGALTPEDAFSLLRKYGRDCLQLGALRSYMKVFFATVDTEIGKFLGYIFHQLDMDGNGLITTRELEKIHIPCDTSGGDLDIDNPRNKSDPNTRLSCDEMYHTFFGSIPILLVDSGHHGEDWNNWDGYENYGSYGSGTMMDKMTKAACDMLYL